MLITVEVKEHDHEYTTIYVEKTHEEFVLPTEYLQGKYPAPLQAGQQLHNVDTRWLKQDVRLTTKRIVNPEWDRPQGYGESW